MRITLCLYLNLVVLQFFLGFIMTNAMVEEKAEAAFIPITSLSPPEGNTTFLDGTTWCVARPAVSPIELQIALDWACGFGKADCHPIQAGGPCYEPNTLLSHASFAFNSYYQQNGNSDIACHFGGTATLTQNNPSYERCAFASSGSYRASGASSSKDSAKKVIIWWKIEVILLILYLRRR
ncbi:hypothetical protein ACJIZ3_013398 [Penstemon smallii]|uniref:X8 domain-containing protein n=1 Tax=Penstemon smallii TaxID=265156 RepID=A0ABD3UR75_9LAMI